MGGESIHLGLVYTTTGNDDEFGDTEWWEATVSANLFEKTIEYSNTDGVFHIEYFPSYEQLAEHIRSMTFDDFYSEWLDRARECSGLDLY